MYNLLHGDCLELMKDIPDKSVDLNRNFIGIELDDKCFEIAKERIENHEV